MVSVVVPVYDVERYLPACLDSVLAQTHRALEVVVVDDGSPDSSGDIAEAYAARDDRVRVVHTPNAGLGAARNEGLRHASGDYVAFLDSDDVVPRTAYATMVRALERSGSDFVTASCVRWEAGELHEPPWMARLHAQRRVGITAGEHPEILGDVFAWNKLFRRSWWESAGLAWPEGVRYEDQPATTRAYLRGRFDVLPDVVYHWRIRGEGSSITQQRSSLDDLRDRFLTKRMTLASVRELGDEATRSTVLDRVLPGDMHRYFTEIPGCSDEWWALLHAGVSELWGERSLVHSGLPPVHRLVGWLVEQDRRADAARLMEYVAGLGGPVPRAVDLADPAAPPRLAVPPEVLDPATVAPAALVVRPHEA